MLLNLGTEKSLINFMKTPDNAFEKGLQKVIPAVLIYLLSGSKVLMIHRNSNPKIKADDHYGKWNGLGGKCEKEESPLEAAKRELFEESGFSLPESQFKPIGVIQFPNFKAKKSEDWCVFVFYSEIDPASSQRPLLASPEGELHWIPREEILSLNLWPGDSLFIPHVLRKEPFMGTIWYENEKVKKHWISLL